jgi:predicted RNA-binding Zn-ribbon protein involved in translation (DUF1610 family)
MGTDTSLCCSDPAEAQPAGEVKLRAALYRWACPNCGTVNAKQPLARQVVCPGCGQPFPTLGTRDEFLVIDGEEPGTRGGK